MTNKTARTRNSNTNSEKRSSTARRGTGFSGWVSRIGRRNAIIVALFVLLFAGLGSFYVQRSLAYYGYYGYPCVAFHIYRNSNLNNCVKPIQYVLQRAGAGNTCPSGYCDGIDGPVTQAAITRFGSWHGYNDSGEVGIRAWNSICDYARYQTPAAANELGCTGQSKVSPSSYGFIY